MRPLMPNLCHTGIWQPLSKPTVTIPPCGIPYVQNFDVVGSKRFTVKYPKLTDAELHQVIDFYNDHKNNNFDFKWRGDSGLAAGTYVAVFESFRFEPNDHSKTSFSCFVSLLAYEEIVL